MAGAAPAAASARGSAPGAAASGTAESAPATERLEVALAAARRAIKALDAAGWGVEALDARLIAGRAALELGRPRLGRRQLELAAAARNASPAHPVQVRTRAWHAAALLRLSHGDRRGASAAVAAGLRALEQHRMTLGATELRAHASGHGEELATLGLRLAVESGSAERVLAAAERRRAAGLLLRPARPPDDEALAAELAELRRVTADLDESLRDGRPDPALTRRQAVLEASVRRRALRTSGGAARQDGASGHDARGRSAAPRGPRRRPERARAARGRRRGSVRLGALGGAGRAGARGVLRARRAAACDHRQRRQGGASLPRRGGRGGS